MDMDSLLSELKARQTHLESMRTTLDETRKEIESTTRQIRSLSTREREQRHFHATTLRMAREREYAYVTFITDAEHFIARVEKRIEEMRQSEKAKEKEDKEERMCSICYESLDGPEAVFTVRECSHEFHRDCLKTWLNR